jgi:hypothetical protein
MMTESPSSKSPCTGIASTAVASSGIDDETAVITEPFTMSGRP